MSKQTIIGFSAGLAMSIIFAGSAFAAPNPAGSGQPGAECGSDTASMMPSGFTTDGFAKAETVYAGSDGTPSADNANSDKAVSQYDVACYQYTQSHQ